MDNFNIKIIGNIEQDPCVSNKSPMYLWRHSTEPPAFNYIWINNDTVYYHNGHEWLQIKDYTFDLSSPSLDFDGNELCYIIYRGNRINPITVSSAVVTKGSNLSEDLERIDGDINRINEDIGYCTDTISDIKQVAFTADYNDLLNTPEKVSLDGYATESFVLNQDTSLKEYIVNRFTNTLETDYYTKQEIDNRNFTDETRVNDLITSKGYLTGTEASERYQAKGDYVSVNTLRTEINDLNSLIANVSNQIPTDTHISGLIDNKTGEFITLDDADQLISDKGYITHDTVVEYIGNKSNAVYYADDMTSSDAPEHRVTADMPNILIDGMSVLVTFKNGWNAENPILNINQNRFIVSHINGNWSQSARIIINAGTTVKFTYQTGGRWAMHPQDIVGVINSEGILTIAGNAMYIDDGIKLNIDIASNFDFNQVREAIINFTDKSNTVNQALNSIKVMLEDPYTNTLRAINKQDIYGSPANPEPYKVTYEIIDGQTYLIFKIDIEECQNSIAYIDIVKQDSKLKTTTKLIKPDGNTYTQIFTTTNWPLTGKAGKIYLNFPEETISSNPTNSTVIMPYPFFSRDVVIIGGNPLKSLSWAFPNSFGDGTRILNTTKTNEGITESVFIGSMLQEPIRIIRLADNSFYCVSGGMMATI